MEIFERNLKVLKEYHNIYLDKELDNADYIVEDTKDNQKIIRVKKDNKWIYIGSKYNNTKITEDFSKSYNIEDGENIYIILGFAMGYHIESLLDNSKENKIIVIEPDLNILKTSFQHKDFTNLISNPRVSIHTYTNENDVVELLEKNIDRSYVRIINFNCYVNYEKVYSEKLNIALKEIKNYIDYMTASSATNILFSKTVLKNYLENFINIVNGYSAVNFRGLFKDKTAVVVSSGPSLKNNIKYLKEYQDKVLILCAGRSLKELLDNGIKPDFVGAVDPGEIMSGLMSSVASETIPMICLDQVNSELINKYKGPKLFYINGLKETFSEILGEKFSNVNLGGSVAHLCTYFAGFLGAKDIVFVGQDLAYTNNEYHSINSSNESLISSKALINTNDSFYVEGNTEKLVLTNKNFYIFKTWFEKFISANNSINFINCTEGGAKIQGAKPAALKETLDNLCGDSIDSEKIIKTKLEENQNRDKKQIVFKLGKLLKKFENIKSESENGVKYSKDMFEYYSIRKKINISDILYKLDKIDKIINKDSELTSLINLCVYEDMQNIELNPNFREKNKENDNEKGKRLALKGIEIYKNYGKAIDMITPLLKETIEKINC